jgi:hypothetical protein
MNRDFHLSHRNHTPACPKTARASHIPELHGHPSGIWNNDLDSWWRKEQKKACAVVQSLQTNRTIRAEERQ